MRVLNGFSNECDRWPLTVESRAGRVAALLGWPRCSADRTVWLAGLLGWPRCLAGCSACLAACFRSFISLRDFEANGPYFLIGNVFLFVLSNGVCEDLVLDSLHFLWLSFTCSRFCRTSMLELFDISHSVGSLLIPKLFMVRISTF